MFCRRNRLQNLKLDDMPKTRRSLFYLATYLFLTGAAFFLAPQATLKLLLANHSYEDPFVQFTGVLMIGLSVVVVNVILFGNPKFYRATLLARIPMWLMILWIYIQTQDPVFIIVLSVLGLGIVITGTSYLIERKQIGIS
jgi:hypothetical protein